jgi:hypothetical protein
LATPAGKRCAPTRRRNPAKLGTASGEEEE